MPRPRFDVYLHDTSGDHLLVDDIYDHDADHAGRLWPAAAGEAAGR